MIRTLLISYICPLEIDNVNSLVADLNGTYDGILTSRNWQLCEPILKKDL
jgi:hypothetical protein